MRDGLAEVKDVFNLTGLNRKQLHQCDELGLVKPTRVQNHAGYKLYDAAALDKLHEVGLYASLGLSVQEIKDCMETPGYERMQVLTDIIGILNEKLEHIKNQIAVAEQLRCLNCRIPEYDSYVIRHMDEVGVQFRKAYDPELLRCTEGYIREMNRLSGGEASGLLLELINGRILGKALEYEAGKPGGETRNEKREQENKE